VDSYWHGLHGQMHHHALIGAKYIQTCVRPLPRGICDMPTLLLITDYQKIESFRRCVYCVEWADDHSGTWFDVNRFTFDKDMHEKRFFTFLFPMTLTSDL